MIKSFRHKGLRELYQSGRSRRVRPDLQARALRRLDALNAATKPSELKMPGFGLHPLGGKPQQYALSVNGPWRITFEWIDKDAHRVNLEQYH